MNKKTIATTAFVALAIPLLSTNALAEREQTMSKIEGRVLSGEFKIEAPDVDFGTLKIGQKIESVRSDGEVIVTDHTGGDGWEATYKDTTYQKNKDTLLLKFNNFDVTDQSRPFTNGKSQLTPKKMTFGASATWGVKPTIQSYRSDILWTLTPVNNTPTGKFKWGTATYYYTAPGEIVVENGVIDNAEAQMDSQAFATTKRIQIGEGVSFPVTANKTFANMPQLKSISGLEKVDTSKTISMVETFSGLNMPHIGVERLDVSNVRTMDKTFYKTSGGKLNLSYWNVKNLQEMNGVFGVSKFDEIDFYRWDTPNLRIMKDSFSSVDFNNTKTDLSYINTSKVTDFYRNFYGSAGLGEANISNWNVSSGKNFQHFFGNTKNSPGFDISKWEMTSVTSTMNMFTNSELNLRDIGLEKVKFGDKLDTVSSTFMNAKYSGPLNLNNMNMTSVKSYYGMFNGAAMSSIDASGWRFKSVTGKTQAQLEADVFSGYKGDKGNNSNWLR